VLLAAPFLICMLLWVLQDVINQQLDARAFRCGCKCLACCDWVAPPAGDGGGAAAALAASVTRLRIRNDSCSGEHCSISCSVTMPWARYSSRDSCRREESGAGSKLGWHAACQS
jgi:hypothetical protein